MHRRRWEETIKMELMGTDTIIWAGFIAWVYDH